MGIVGSTYTAWTEEEDKLLFETISEYRNNGWKINEAIKKLELDMPTRTKFAIRKRFDKDARSYQEAHPELNLIGNRTGTVNIRWTEEEDNIIVEAVAKAIHNGIGKDAAFLAASENPTLSDRTVKAISERFYKLKRDGVISPLLLGESPRDEQSDDDGPMDLAQMFVEMKKIIRERDELKAKYEDALAWKTQYEEIKKKLSKIEKESASFMDLLRRRA